MLFLKDEKNGTFDSNVGYIPLPASIRIKYLASNFSKKKLEMLLLHGIDKEKNHRL